MLKHGSECRRGGNAGWAWVGTAMNPQQLLWALRETSAAVLRGHPAETWGKRLPPSQVPEPLRTSRVLFMITMGMHRLVTSLGACTQELNFYPVMAEASTRQQDSDAAFFPFTFSLSSFLFPLSSFLFPFLLSSFLFPLSSFFSFFSLPLPKLLE